MLTFSLVLLPNITHKERLWYFSLSCLSQIDGKDNKKIKY